MAANSNIVIKTYVIKTHLCRETLDALHADHQRLQDRCLCLESAVLAKEEELCVKAQEFREQESERLSGEEELRASASFWNEKWQAATLSLSSTQRELEAMKQQDPGHKVRLAVCKQLHVQTLFCTK